MKHFYLRFLMVFAVIMTCGATAFAEEYSYTLADGDFSKTKFSNEYGGVTWTLDGDNLTSVDFYFTSKQGVQFGKGSNLFSSMTLSTSDIHGTISSIKVNTSSTVDDNAPTLTVTVGGIQYGETYNLTKNPTEQEFTGNTSGEIVLSYSQTSTKKRAIYIKSITVTYGDGTTVTKKATKVTFGDEYDGKTIDVKEGGAVPDVLAKVYATDDQETPIDGAVLSYSSSDESVASVDANGKVTLNAFGTTTITAAFAETDEYKASSASYTINYESAEVSDNKIIFDAAEFSSFKSIGSSYNKTESSFDFYDNNETAYTFTCFQIMKKNSSKQDNAIMQMKATDGYIVSPEFNFASGYKVAVYYSSRDNTQLTLSIGDTSIQGEGESSSADSGTGKVAQLVTNSTNASFKIDNKTDRPVYISRIEIIPNSESSSVSLSEKEDNSSAISENNDKTVDVTLTRTLDNTAWNTLCLPFDVDAATVTSTFGDGTKLKEYASDNVNSITFKDATSIEAGKPYFIMPGNATVENPTFTGVTINAKADTLVSGTNFDIVGIYSPKELDADTDLFVGTDNKLYRPSGSRTLNGMRVYIRVKNTDVTPSSIMLSFGGDGQTTGITSAVNDNAAKANGMIYNLNGQAVGKDAGRLGKGLYIMNGKKVIIK